MSASMKKESARRRRPISAKKHLTDENDFYFIKEGKTQIPYLPSVLTWILLLCVHFGMFLFIHWRFNSFPYHDISEEPSLETHKFYERNARVHLDTIFSFGPRVTGSRANEILAKEYIMSEIKKIESDVHVSKRLTIDMQNVSGAFHMEKIIGTEYYSVYKNLKNIVAKLEPSGGVDDHLLINCHYDTATNSPGAGDNAVSCAVMLEILRALSHSDHKLQHGVIFLFNGAEENVLQASHGFITQHPWAKTIKAFINLDSAGAGGWELVFQTGPEHPWLVKAYAESVHYPFATILGQELFQSGIIPSDTDYRIFRDFGKIPGLDIAHISNGYIYHTFNDKIQFIPPGSIQRTGENLMSLIQKLCSSDKLADPGTEKHGAMVFYDFVGYFMIYYTHRVGVILNCVMVGFAFLSVLLKFSKRHFQISSVLQHLKYVSGAIIAIIGTWIVTMIILILLGWILSVCRYSLFWYTNTFNVITVYMLPAIVTVLCIHSYLKEKYLKGFEAWYIESVFFDGSLMIWSLLTLVLTLCGLGSAGLPMHWVAGPVLFREATFQLFKKSLYANTRLFLTLHITSLLAPLLFTTEFFYCIFMIFIPIFGRSGTIANSELVMAALSSVVVLTFMQYLIGLVYLCENVKSVIKGLSIASLIGLILVLVTPLGFPYSGNDSAPSSQRVVALHINRNFHSQSGSIEKSDSGIWFLPFDYNAGYHLQRSNVLSKAVHPECEGPYCGLPYKIPLLHLFDARKTLYETREKANVSPKVTVNLFRRETIESDVLRLTFHVTGPDHMTCFIVPVKQVGLVGWSISGDTPRNTRGPPGEEKKVYFIYYSHAEEPSTPWEFYLDLKINLDHHNTQPVIDIAFTGQYLHIENSRTKEAVAFIESLPDWTVPTVWAATYDAYKF